MKKLTGAWLPLLKSGSLALAVGALLFSATAGHAGQVTIKRVTVTPSPSPAALANAKSMSLPELSNAQMKALGLLNEDGSVAELPKSNRSRSSAKVLSKGNPGGPPLGSIEVFSEKYLTAGETTRSPGSTNQGSGSVAPMNYGISEYPFSTSRVELAGKQANSKVYPYRAVGKLYILNADGSTLGHCSASMIAKGVLVTAAHCVAEYGTGTTYANWVFYPGFYNGKAVGKAFARAVVLPNSYLYGGGCLPDEVTCIDDVAMIVLADSRGKYLGSKTGWLGFASDLWGFTSYYETHVTQLGYPGGIDYGNQMIRNDSQGLSVDGTVAYNTIIGSQMNGGSSGGPWITNFGVGGVNNGVGAGYDPYQNMVVGVSSWGYPNAPVFKMGASPFLSSNVEQLYSTACAAFPLACAP